MARLLRTVEKIVPTGLQPNMSAPTVDGDMIPADGRSVLIVSNGSAGSLTVTAQTPATMGGLPVSEQVVTVAAAATGRLIGPFDAATYGRPDGGADPGMVYIDFSVQASITRGYVKI